VNKGEESARTGVVKGNRLKLLPVKENGDWKEETGTEDGERGGEINRII